MHLLALRDSIKIHYTYFNKLELGKRKPSPKLAKLFENASHITKFAWLFPEEIFNPYLPHLYKGPYPPDLSHLNGEPRNWALIILANFPERPPTLEEWRKFRKEVFHSKKNTKPKNNGGQSHDKT